jgi:protein-tyrosine sulfotransferase
MTKICFLLGIMPRCGTNFLEKQICLHPECVASGPVWEDFLLSNTNYLNNFGSRLEKNWDSYWFRNTSVDYPLLLKQYLGDGMVRFLLNQLKENKSADVFVSKTPTIKRICNFPLYFSTSKLIIVVRDGRSIIASGQKSFDWDFLKAVVDWKLNAQEVIDFINHNRDIALLVKYEELCTNPKSSMKKIMKYLEVPESEYPWDKLETLPIFGSSDLRDKSGELHWKPVVKDNSFNSLERFSKWPKWKHMIFNVLAQNEMEALEYSISSDVTFLDKLATGSFVILWPFWGVPRIAYYLLRYRKLIVKTN